MMSKNKKQQLLVGCFSQPMLVTSNSFFLFYRLFNHVFNKTNRLVDGVLLGMNYTVSTFLISVEKIYSGVANTSITISRTTMPTYYGRYSNLAHFFFFEIYCALATVILFL